MLLQIKRLILLQSHILNIALDINPDLSFLNQFLLKPKPQEFAFSFSSFNLLLSTVLHTLCTVKSAPHQQIAYKQSTYLARHSKIRVQLVPNLSLSTAQLFINHMALRLMLQAQVQILNPRLRNRPV